MSVENNNQEPSEIKSLIQRAISDSDFKNLLLSNPNKAMEGYNFTEAQIIMIKSLREEDINKLTSENLEEYFSADSAVYTPDVDQELLMDEAEEDDIK